MVCKRFAEFQVAHKRMSGTQYVYKLDTAYSHRDLKIYTSRYTCVILLCIPIIIIFI